MPDDEPTRLLPTVGRPPHSDKDHPTAERHQPVPVPDAPLPPDSPDSRARVILLASLAAVVGLGGMLTVIVSTRDASSRPTASAQMVMPTLPAPTSAAVPSKAATNPASAAPTTAATPSARHTPAPTAASRPPSLPADPTVPLAVGATIGLEVAGKPGLRLHYQQAVVRVDQLSSASDLADRVQSRFVVRQGLGLVGCVSFEAVGNPGFFLRRFFGDLVLHKRDGSPVFDQEATFCPEPAADGKGVVLVVRFPAGFVVVASTDGLLHLDAPDLTSRTAFVVRKPL